MREGRGSDEEIERRKERPGRERGSNKYQRGCREGERPTKIFEVHQIDGMTFVPSLFLPSTNVATFIQGDDSARYKCEAKTFDRAEPPPGINVRYLYELVGGGPGASL
jgi:hypothetical protein